MCGLGQTRPSWPRLHVHSCPQSPPIAAVNDRVPARVTHLASEAATLGSPLPCARLDVGAISVCIAARPPNLGREKDLLHFLCIGLFVCIFEILRGNPRCGNGPQTAQGFKPLPRHRPVVGTEIPPEAIQNAFACERHLRAAGRLLPLLSVQSLLQPI